MGGERAEGKLTAPLVMPDQCGEGEYAREHPGGDPGEGAAAMALEIELALQGPIDRLNDLTEVAEQVTQMCGGVALKARLGGEAQQCLDHRQGDALGVRELRAKIHRGSRSCVHEASTVDRWACNADHGRPSRARGGSRLRRDPLESVILEQLVC